MEKIHGIFSGDEFTYIGGARSEEEARGVYTERFPEDKDKEINVMELPERQASIPLILDPSRGRLSLRQIVTVLDDEGAEFPSILATSKNVNGWRELRLARPKPITDDTDEAFT